MSNNLKWLAIINPASGGGRAKKKWKKTIRKKLVGLNLNFEEYFTNGPGDAITQIISRIDDYDGFMSIGGDGTCNEVINGIMNGTIGKGNENNKLLSILPAGTGNDIANAFGLPYNNIDESCILFNPEKSTTKSVDVGKVTGYNFDNEEVVRYFCGVFSTGFDAEVAYKTNFANKWLPGTATYVKALLSNIIWLKSRIFDFKVINGSEIDSYSIDGIFFAVGLGAYYGGGMMICPEAKVDDGIFHATFLSKVSRRTLLRVFPRVYKGEHVTHQAISLYSGPNIEITTQKRPKNKKDKNTFWQVDGEVIGYNPVKIETLAKKLNVLSPKIEN